MEQEFLADLRRLGELHQAHLAAVWSLRAAARAIGLAPTTVSEWLKGRRFPQQSEAFTKLITLLRTALADARINVQPGDRHLLDPDAWRTRHQAVAQQRAGAVSSAVRRAQATAALADAEVRARFAAVPDKPRPVSAWTAEQLGVHPAIHGTTHRAEGAFVLPDYVERDHDQRLRARLDAAVTGRQAVMVVVRGESCTGKSRAAYEAVRACLGHWQLVFPKSAASLLALLAADALAPRTVLWLNEAQDFLHGPAGEASAAALRRRLEGAGPVVVLATLWLAYHRALTATPEPGKDSHPHARALLDPVVPVDIPERFTPEDLTNLRASNHSSLAAAGRTSPRGTITQTLAAGPQLVDHYEQAVLPQGPYAKAIITAAMDARRLGHISPLPAALLRAAAPGYLAEEQRAAAPVTWFADALAYARTKVMGVVSALEPVADPNGMGALPDVFRLADYLHHHARTTRFCTFPPGSLWTALRDHTASTTELNDLADSAVRRCRYRTAADLYQRSADAGDTDALTGLAWLRKNAGDTEGAERLYRRAADAGHTGALTDLAVMYEWAGDPQGAERFAQRAAAAGNTFGLRRIGELREQAGDTEGAEQMYQRAADAGDTDALTHRDVVRFSHTTLDMNLLNVRSEAGDLDALMEWALILEAYGNAPEAERLYRRAADAGDMSALTGLAVMYERAGDPQGAERFAQRAAAAGNTFGLILVGQLREQAEDLEGAERMYRRAADAGNPGGLMGMGQLREQAGDTEGAEQLRRFGLEVDGSPSQPW
ncbi:helix-turn-helix domain-containing/SEL1-like repeat protein [Streptomyces orinoci]|uniref:Helix-turn-helix domain-containing/SEL1-like repeat protein n=1 Tax=Streptomyces orinoci TaxID=67339 RepID=A0ABV3K2K1_STRON|nr:helix-turn-helix domain-containing/SEL1-like repeat protein [Streptomyces orinoci]